MNRLVSLLFAVTVMLVVEVSMENIFKVKEQASLDSRLLKDPINSVHGRERRSTTSGKLSYLYFDNRSGRTAELWYRTPSKSRKWIKFKKLKRDATFEMFTFEEDEWVALDKKTQDTLEINGDTKYYKPKANTEKSRAVCILTRKDQKDGIKIEAFVETFVVVDKTVRDRFKSDSEVKRYVKVLFSLASDSYRHKSLTQHGLDIHIIPSKIHVQRHKLKLDPSKEKNNAYTACKHMNKLEEKKSKKFDHKLFLTRTEFGRAGYASPGTMCGRYSSCSIVKDYGFQAAYMIAHEIGHSLGLEHDNATQYSRLIMASAVDSLFNNHSWSAQSQYMLTKKIRDYTDECLGNKPAKIMRYQYPGVHYSFQRQCDIEYGEDYTAWQPTKWQRDLGVDACAMVKCNMPGQSQFRKLTGSPALDGTKCGENMYCLSGKCREKSSDEIENQVVVRVNVVNI